MATEVKHRRHRWLGHVLRMEQALRWNPPGKRKQVRPKITLRKIKEEEECFCESLQLRWSN